MLKKTKVMASYVKVDDVIIPIFHGADYANWKKRILKFFEFKKCKNPATRERTQTDNLEEWNQADMKATNCIYSSITNKQLEYIGDLDSTYKIMRKFDEMYLKESTALQILCRNRLENVKLKDFTDVTSFFDEFEKAINELKAAGGKISEQEKLRYMLKALPPSYSYVGDLIDVLPDKEKTVDYLKSKIKLKSLKEKNNKEGDQPNSNAFSTDMRGKCFTCGKPGHKQIECQRGSIQQGRGRGHGLGQNRGIYHYNQRGYQRGSYNRGRSSNRGTPSSSWNHQGQHSANSNVFITEVNVSQTNCEKNKVNRENKINWILDSGCTDHIVNDDTIFDEFVILTKPIDVKLGDGRILNATKIGNIKTTFQIYGKDSEIVLYIMYFMLKK